MGLKHPISQDGVSLPGYVRLEGGPGTTVLHAPALTDRGRQVLDHLESGFATVPDLLGLPAPALEAMIVADEEWSQAPRESSRAYPTGLPYFTRATNPPALVLPETLSAAIQPRTPATLPLVVHHELAHAFLAGRMAARPSAWLRELPPQATSAAMARREGQPLDEHLSEIPEVRSPGFTIRSFRTPAGAEAQMAFQNLLLKLGAAALEEFGEGFLVRLSSALCEGCELDEARAAGVLADALGEGGREWLASRKEF